MLKLYNFQSIHDWFINPILLIAQQYILQNDSILKIASWIIDDVIIIGSFKGNHIILLSLLYRWFKEGFLEPLEGVKIIQQHGIEPKVSAVLTLTPTRSDDGQVYKCQVSNRAMPEGTKLENKVALSVNCKYKSEIFSTRNLFGTIFFLVTTIYLHNPKTIFTYFFSVFGIRSNIRSHLIFLSKKFPDFFKVKIIWYFIDIYALYKLGFVT